MNHTRFARRRMTCALALGFACFTLAALLFVAPSSVMAKAPATVEFSFHHENILGTSLDLVVVAPDEKTAAACEQTVLAEIKRLRKILSHYDSQSEVSRLNRETKPLACSRELIDVLQAYEHWQSRSYGALNGQVGELARLWKAAERANQLPTDEQLQPVVRQIHRPGWRIDPSRGTVEKLTAQPINLNAIGKGYIIGRAARQARGKHPRVSGLLLNIGGDMLALGESAAGQGGWRIGVTDPQRPEENSLPLAELELKDRAVATSAAYERYYTIGGRRYSHIFDPRTGWPAEGVASATVVARDNVTANALATSLCVLSPDEGLALVEATEGAACLIVAADGRQIRSRRLSRVEVSRTVVTVNDDITTKWPKDFQVTISVELIQPTEGKIRRPYAAIWIEDAEKKRVRTLTVWGNRTEYLRDLTSFWKKARDQRDLVDAVTRATRAPGRYSVVWNGLDDAGQPVERGTYTVVVEVHREFGQHVKQSGKIECRDEKAEISLKGTDETGATKVEFAPRGT